MTIPTFPTLSGLSFPVKKSPTFQTIPHKSVAGTSTAQSTQPFSLYHFELPFEFLRSSSAHAELQSLMSFYEGLSGRANPFHFNDPDDNTVTGQALNVGDGATKNFALVRTYGNSVKPVLDAIAAGMVIYVNGVAQTLNVDYTLLLTSGFSTIYGVAFAAAPGNGLVVSADFSYNWLCQFDDDAQEFSKFLKLNGFGLWDSKAVKFTEWGQ